MFRADAETPLMDTAGSTEHTSDAILERVRALAPALRARAGQAERDRCIPTETIDDFRATDMFRMMQPKNFGGFEMDFAAGIRVQMEIGKSCASSAWVGGLGITHQWLIANFPLQAQEDVWRDNSGAIAFGSYSAHNRAEPVDGGFLATGNWAFSSGCDHGQWALLGITFPADDEHENPYPGLMLAPESDYGFDDDWHTVGLAATGSKTIVCDRMFVPDHRRIAFTNSLVGESPGSKIHDNPLYRLPLLAMLPFTLTAPIIGALDGAIEDFIADHGSRLTRGAVGSGGSNLGSYAGVQTRLADACGALDAAKLMTFRCLDETFGVAKAGEPVTIDMRIRNRLAHGYTVKLALDAINGLYAATGGAGLYTNSRIQRAWRDITAASHHVSLNWDALSTLFGQHVLGLNPKGSF